MPSAVKSGEATADVVVIGLGAVGSAVLFQLARSGVPAIGIDRYHPPHTLGSSHGETRISRLAVGEGAAYAPLVRRSHQLWREIEAESGADLFTQTGGLVMGPRTGAARHHGTADFITRTVAVAEQTGIAHEVLDSVEIGRRYPQFALRGDEVAFYEPSAGMLAPERCVATQLRLAAAHGATVRTGEQVLQVSQTGDVVRVTTDRGAVTAQRVVVTAGPWLRGLIGGCLESRAVPYRQVLHWFEVQDGRDYAPGRFPVFIWMHGNGEEDYFYGFPHVPGSPGLKVATEQYGASTDPDRVVRDVAPGESRAMFTDHVSGRLRGVGPRVTQAAACLYTVTPDAGFIVDDLPGNNRVLVVSACSGHGFKHSAALGEAVAQRLATGASTIDLTAFGLARFDPTFQTPGGSTYA